MTNKLKAIILLIAIVLGGIFIANMSPSDDKLKRKNNELRTQITELTNYNNSLKDQNKIYESQIGDLTTENNTKDATIEELQAKVEELEAVIESNKKVTDLLNTTWIFNDTISAPAGYGSYAGEFIIVNLDGYTIHESSTGVFGIGFRITPDFKGDEIHVFEEVADCLGTSPSFMEHTNAQKSFYSIEFKESFTDTSLIDWLYANATLVK